MSTEAETIQIVLNGKPATLAAGETILGLLRSLDIAPDRVAVELDRRIVRPPEWATKVLDPGAEVEIVHFVGGG